ncbi:hypothetical protein QSH57_008673 [Fusarium oxysporum f. sp. vasinfectum]|nr:hypothetical protein QSH57_008673 [Fusarium oxysporum f. sp. vasinfectum]
MPGIPKKRGRPRKYGTPKDKAKHDIVAKRARRRLRNIAGYTLTGHRVV